MIRVGFSAHGLGNLAAEGEMGRMRLSSGERSRVLGICTLDIGPNRRDGDQVVRAIETALSRLQPQTWAHTAATLDSRETSVRVGGCGLDLWVFSVSGVASL